MRSLTFGLVAVTLAVSACGSDSLSGGVTVTASEPAFGSLVGGSRIVLTGTGFSADGAAPNRVLVGGIEAPLAGAIDDSHLEVEVPPGLMAGDAEVVVFNHRGQGNAMGIFHYSTAPVISGVNPSDILYTTPSTVMTVTGSGFMDEAAGYLHVQVDGVDAVDVEVLSDMQVKFTAFAGPLLTQPTITIVDDRGTNAKERAFRYVPSTHHGLIIFPRAATNFVEFYDAVDQSVTGAPRTGTLGANVFPSTVIAKGSDFFFATRNRSTGTAQLGKLDFRAQNIGREPLQLQTSVMGMALAGDVVYATLQNSQFGTLDLTTGAFSSIVTLPNTSRGYELTADATGKLYLAYGTVNNGKLNTIATDGTLGTEVALTGSPSPHVSELRFLDGTLYALTWNNGNGTAALLSINPTTGATTTLKTFDDQRNAMEVFQ